MFLNKQLLEKIIKTSDTACPVFTYENPLLDHTVAAAVSKSLVKILRVSQPNSNINNNLRYSILANIRKMCHIQPLNHVEVDDTTTSLLTEIFTEEIKHPHTNNARDPILKILDDFVTQHLMDQNPSNLTVLNPEVAQSLINLNDCNSNIISHRVLDLDSSSKSNTFVKQLWAKSSEGLTNICDISIRMKPEIEQTLLETCQHLLEVPTPKYGDLIQTDKYKDLIEKCSLSPKCFQICCGVLNYVFINTNFHTNIQVFISEFVKNVMKMCQIAVSALYSNELSHVVVLMDCDIKHLPLSVQENYIQNTLVYLNKLHLQSEPSLIMLLSHYPSWFDIFLRQ